MEPSRFDLQVFWAALLASIFAEIACLVRNEAIVARCGSPFSVFLGALLGDAILLLPVLLFGSFLHRLPPAPVRVVSAAIFILVGLLIFFDRRP